MSDSDLVVPADFESIRALGPWLREVLAPLGPERAEANAGPIELAIHELATNSIDHAKGTQISFAAQLQGDSIAIVVTDDGDPLEETTFENHPLENRAEPQEPQVRGYGLMIIEQLATSVSYDRQSSLNTWTLNFALSRSC